MGLFDWLRKKTTKEERAALPQEPTHKDRTGAKRRRSEFGPTFTPAEYARRRTRRRLEREGRRNARG